MNGWAWYLIAGLISDIIVAVVYIDRQRPVYGPGVALLTLAINALAIFAVLNLAGVA